MLVAGLMSGTSADGIDVALVEIDGLGWKTRFRVVAFESHPYPPAVRRKVLEIAGGASVPASEISQLNFLLGELFARACQTACRRTRVPLKKLALIGSHGQTVYHQGRDSLFCGMPVRSTLQIGEPSVIASRTGVATVGDFRPADIAAGGQGAPLVPFFDYLLYRHPRRGRVVLNIGGIANITAIPAGGEPEDVIAFDTGPGNMLLDALASLATKGKLSYDADGGIGATGAVSERLLQRILHLDYFHQPPPKTTGREQFGKEFLERYFLRGVNSARNRPQALRDALATATALTAESIARGIGDFVLPKFPVAECLVSGGGVKNRFLMEEFRRRLLSTTDGHRGAKARRASLSKTKKLRVGSTDIKIVSSDEAGIPSDGKEAVAFAVLAYHTFRRKPSNLPSATGARQRAILGKIAYGIG
jgi:anhydro-N-acetylmuramic acid kinase